MNSSVKLDTQYLGLALGSPLIASAGPLTGKLDNIRRLEELGAGAVVLPSVFEEQIEREQQLVEQLMSAGADSCGEALSYFPQPSAYALDSERYLDLIERAVRAVDLPVIASLNGVSNRGWIEYARRIESAGAAAIELNIYFVACDVGLSGAEVEQRYIDTLSAVKRAVSIPVAVKLGPYFSAFAQMAQRLDAAGANGLVLFNRFYEPDIDLAQLSVTPDLSLSRSEDIRLPLLWTAVLHGRLRASLAATSGVHSVEDVVKYLLAGADVVMTTAALLKYGIGHMRVLVDGLRDWLQSRGLDSPGAIRGRMSQQHTPEPAAFERANYIRVLQSYRG